MTAEQESRIPTLEELRASFRRHEEAEEASRFFSFLLAEVHSKIGDSAKENEWPTTHVLGLMLRVTGVMGERFIHLMQHTNRNAQEAYLTLINQERLDAFYAAYPEQTSFFDEKNLQD